MKPLLCTALVLVSLPTLAADDGASSERTPLFNGEDFTGWHGMPHFDPRKLAEMSEDERQAQLDEWQKGVEEHWRIEDGVIVNDGHGPYLTTDREYGDVELWIEYKTVPGADSGIYLRGTPQVQIWDPNVERDDPNGAYYGSGGLFNNSPGAPGRAPAEVADREFGEWNSFRILQVGARTSVWMNDKLVVDHAVMENYWDREQPLFRRGVIQLQTHGGEIRWRNLYVREIAPDEANKILREKAGSGFESVFNGSDLSGWSGATDNYEVRDGVLRCKPGEGGVLFTDDTYADHQIQLDIHIPEGGNNGLAIRYPGEGNAAYGAMTELQVLDNDAEKYATLDPRQYHGSAYGMVPAVRGYLRDDGVWNHQLVTVKGSTIVVELNGTPILDADLSEVTEFMGDRPHPGKDRVQGHFGFAGHNDPVGFRHIGIKRLSASE